MYNMIPVTKSFIPPLEEYTFHIKRAFANGWLTNRGELVMELEYKLRDYLSISNVLLMNNGTIPLQISMHLFGKGGEIITTPFSYVATTSSIVWEKCTPIYVDIDPEYLTIDVTKIENAITEKTTCILATHVFGNPCNVEEIERIARKYDLYVIYDGAHSFGVQYKGKSIFEYGDVSTCSFHATKLFQSGEGGAVFCKKSEIMDKFYHCHNFGHHGYYDYHDVGINGKMSELHAAMGLSTLPYVEKIIDSNRKIVDTYHQYLNWNKIRTMNIKEGTKWNFSYFPVIFEDEDLMVSVNQELIKHNIYGRRYFYPSLNQLKYVENQKLEVADKISSTILCLPLYFGLEEKDILRICQIINSFQ